MNIETEYARLESQMMSYDDYANMPTVECGEKMIAIKDMDGVIASSVRSDALPITGTETFVREGVAQRLMVAAGLLKSELPGAVLDVGYGYRALSVQQSRFAGVIATLSTRFEGEELQRAAHRQVAVPKLAGHPAGAAVDISISRKGSTLNFGTDLWDFSRKSYTKSPEICGEARENRTLLSRCMTEAGFAPFLGEWWHFSYGDKEWAAFSKQPNAIYEQVEFRAPDITRL